jgi:hypothetical protein
VTFAPSENGKTVVANYMGRGIIQYPDTRIYHVSESGDILQLLLNHSYLYKDLH